MRLLIVGAAVSGLAAARLGRRLGHSVAIYDHDPSRTADIIGQGFGAVVGDWDVTSLGGIDLVVASPGVPERALPFTHANELGIPVISEIEFAWRELTAPTVAVTGTNGKTTVTSLISSMLVASGYKAPALGNIGDPLSDAVGSDIDIAVVEISSFQLRFVSEFNPHIAVVTNVAPDHLDWHGSFQAYLDCKANIIARHDDGQVLVVDGDDEGALQIAGRTRGVVAAVSGRRRLEAGGVDGEHLWFGRHAVPLAHLQVSDQAFLVDLAMAAVAAVHASADPDGVRSVLRSFAPGAHRRTMVGKIGGVAYIDDSKATNPHAALAAIRAFPSVVLIAGGLAKGLDVEPLAIEPNVRFVVAIGTSADRLLAARPAESVRATSMKEAVEAAHAAATPGDTVLLAPGCASFDMFESYGARGDAFSEAVRAMMELEGSTK